MSSFSSYCYPSNLTCAGWVFWFSTAQVLGLGYGGEGCKSIGCLIGIAEHQVHFSLEKKVARRMPTASRNEIFSQLNLNICCQVADDSCIYFKVSGFKSTSLRERSYCLACLQCKNFLVRK